MCDTCSPKPEVITGSSDLSKLIPILIGEVLALFVVSPVICEGATHVFANGASANSDEAFDEMTVLGTSG